MHLADFVCYSLQSQGEAVVRRNVESKLKKKGKKGGEETVGIVGYKVSQTLHENPPFRQLREKISKFIDFETDSLQNKYWVIAVSGGLDDNVVQ